MMKITVLMTVYNGERYLKECIDSVLNQTYKDFEFLIVNDASTDKTRDIIKSYDDKRIRLVDNERNLSQVVSLNIGLDHARGDYIARIDQDDLMAKNRLKRQLDFMDRRPDVAVVGTWGEVIDESGKVLEGTRLPIRNEEIVGTALFCGYFLMHTSVMFRREAAVDSGKYDESLSFSEDFDLWTRLLLKRYKLANIPEPLIKFRYHEKSSSRQFPAVQIKNACFSLSNFIDTVKGSKTEELSDILINAGLMNKGFWSNNRGADDSKEIGHLVDGLLKKTIEYFNFNKKEIYFMKKIFYTRILNFAFQGYDSEDRLSFQLYLQCLRNYFYILERPKLYIYPLLKLFHV